MSQLAHVYPRIIFYYFSFITFVIKEKIKIIWITGCINILLNNFEMHCVFMSE